MSHDAATSRRREKPELFAQLDIAIAQSGVKGIDSDGLYALSSWSIRQGRRFPWFYKHEKIILATEGGRDQVVMTIAGAALAYMQDDEFLATVENDKFLAAACYEAGKGWRSDLRRQWGDLVNQYEDWQNPVLFTDLGHDRAEFNEDGGEHEPIEDYLTEHAVELAGPTAPEFDPRNIEDPRLARLWSALSDREQETLVILADGTNMAQAGELLGITRQATQSRMNRIRDKARGAAA